MPAEYLILKDRPVPLASCPKCGSTPFRPFMRGMVLSYWRDFFGRPAWSLICSKCKEIVGHERADKGEAL